MENVLLITVDSLRADHVGWHGYGRETTPNLDEVAADASVFENTYTHACSTRPSFPSILTSSYPLMYGGFERISENRTLVQEVLDDAGYRTGGFHSNAYLNPEFGYDRGFDYFFNSMTDPGTTARLRQWAKTQLNEDGVIYKLLASLFFAAERQAGANIGSAYVDADEITDSAIEWLETGGEEDQPEFCWIHYMDVHHPYIPPAEHQLAFRDEPISERQAVQLRRKFIEQPDDITEKELDDIIDLYDAEIRFCDAEIGRLLDTVEDLWDEYTVVFTADHGEEFLDHGGFSHRTTFYEEVSHVPLLIDDGVHSGRFDDIVGLLDVAPTILDYAGCDIPDNFYGYSLLDLFDGEWEREHVLGDSSANGRGEEDCRYGYRDDRWKYVRRQGFEELFDLQADPDEQRNVLEEYPDVADRLRRTVDDHIDEIEATNESLGEVDMDEEVKEQLRDLGYAE